jgi:two-component system NtrC family sensor kinase
MRVPSKLTEVLASTSLDEATLERVERVPDDERRELTERIEDAQRSTAEILDVLDRLPDPVIIHREGVLLWMNRVNVKALGFERLEEVVGKPMLDFVVPESRDLIRSRMRQPINADVPELSEIRLKTRDGSILVLEIAPAQHVTFDRKSCRLIVGRDVTDRARLQQQLLIADRMASIGMLAAGVAHEVNNPLAYVLNNIEIAMRLLEPLGDSTHQTREVLEVALEGVDRIRTIVRDLLSLSRVDDVVIGPIDVLGVVESTLTLASKTISERAVLSFERHAVPLARGNVARLGQVLINLVTNALEAMPRSARDTNQLRIAVRPSNGGGVVIEVSDNGVGIQPENAARIFEPFFTTKAAGSGTGLGLAICQRLVTEMGGWIAFESTPQQGTTFRVTLAAAGPESDISQLLKPERIV